MLKLLPFLHLKKIDILDVIELFESNLELQCNVLLTFESVDETLSVTMEMKTFDTE